MRDLLSVVNLHTYFSLPKTTWFQKRPILRANENISFSVREGETLGLVGESGSGKSTLGRSVLQLIRPTLGQVLYYGAPKAFLPRYLQKKKGTENTETTGAGIDLTKLTRSEMRRLRKDLQIVFQDPYSSLNPRMTVEQIIEEGVTIHLPYRKGSTGLKAYVAKIMEECGLSPSMRDRYPHQFSGGQRQRICIARALAVQPKFIVCDECVSALDVSIQAQILNLLCDLKERQRLTYLFISHDLSVVRYLSDRIAVMYLGKIVELGLTRQIFENPCHPYTRRLLETSLSALDSKPSLPAIPSQKTENVATILRGDAGHNDLKGVFVETMQEVEKEHFVRMDFETP